MIDFEHVSKEYKKGGRLALEDINLHVDDGEFVFLLGHSGAGKSTLLKLILREELPTSGKVTVLGKDVAHLRRRKVPYLRRQMGTKASITSREKDIGFSSITNQGLPFYGGNITYKVKVDTPDCDLCVHASRYAGALVRVAFDGRDCGKIVYAPYKLDIKNVKSGKHEIEFTVCGNRYNTFGALHDCSHSRWAGSNMWSERDENWCYEYCVKDTGLLASPVIEIIEK